MTALEAETARRALAALRGLVVGDAIGAATEGYRPGEVEEVYDAPITEPLEPVNLYPESAPDRKRAEAGSVTRAAIAGARRLLGVPGGAIEGDALGWAAPLGLVSVAGSPDLITRAASFADGEACAAGAALAAAIAAGLGSRSAGDAVGEAVTAALAAGSPALADAITQAAAIGQASGGQLVGAQVAAEYPPGPERIPAVAFAFGVAVGVQSVRRAMLEAANQGGEASLTAALAGALCGAVAPGSIVESWAVEVETVNGLDLMALTSSLLALRPPPAPPVETKSKKKR